MDCVALKVPLVFFVRGFGDLFFIYDVISINLIADCFKARHRYRLPYDRSVS